MPLYYNSHKTNLFHFFVLFIGILSQSTTQASPQKRLIYAIQNGTAAQVKKILSKSKKFDFIKPNIGTFNHQDTILTYAARLGDTKKVTAILKHPRALHPDLQYIPSRITPLLVATQNGHAEVVKVLIAHGADPNLAKTDHGATPLHFASYQGNLEIVQELISHQAELNVTLTNKHGATPLHLASQNGHLEIVKELITHGADPNISLTQAGVTALELAVLNGHKLIETFLTETKALSELMSTNKNEYLRLLSIYSPSQTFE
jgi:ankyrin repeat protein